MLFCFLMKRGKKMGLGRGDCRWGSAEDWGEPLQPGPGSDPGLLFCVGLT